MKDDQEWTEGKVFAYFESEDFKGLADAINAAIAAERKAYLEHAANGAAIIQQLREQLATSVEALKQISRGSQDAFDIADAALAKIKEGK